MPILKQTTAQPPRAWNLRPSVGTWMLPRPRLQLGHRSAATTAPKTGPAVRHAFSTEQQAELEVRQACFDLFWYKLDQEAEAEKFAFMAAELEIRQAAFVFFWQQLDVVAEDEHAAFMAAELEIRQAAFSFFWQQLDEAEENDKFASMMAELEVRQSAFDSFWREIDAATQGQQAVAETATAEFSSSSTYGFIMAGSPAKNLRKLAKDSASASAVRFDIDETWSSKLSTYLKLPLDVSGSEDTPKSRRGMTRSSSTSAMALDLGLDRRPNPRSSRSSSITLQPVKATGSRKSGRAMQQLEKDNWTMKLSSQTEFRGWDMSSSLRRD